MQVGIRESLGLPFVLCGSVAEWLACWTQVQKGLGSNRSRNSLRQTVHTHCASVHQAAKLVAAFLRVAVVTAGNRVSATLLGGWLGSRVVSVLDSGAVGPGFKSQPRRCRVTV